MQSIPIEETEDETDARIPEWLPSNRLLVFIGQNTLVYFAFHGKVQRAVEVICSRIRISRVPETLLILVIQCICLAGAGIIINRYFPFLAGKKAVHHSGEKESGSGSNGR